MATLNVVRYTALVSGIFYGIVHLRTLRKEHAHELEAHKAHQREKWVEQAKAEFKKKQEQGKSGLKGLLEAGKEAVGQAGSVITDPEDPKFDLEKVVQQWEKQNA